ncbi:ATP-binding protein [Pseudooceanicola sp.]
MSSVLNLPLRSRLILLAVAAALITGAVTSAAAYFLVRGSEFAAADQRLGAAARLHSAKLRATLDLIRADAASIAAMPAVPGIIRSSTSADGTDAQERSDFALWQRRLETIFAAILSTRPAYTQLRYIGIADNWKELVRVNQGAEGPTAVRGDALQSKAAEPYLQHPDFLAAGRTLFSQVTYNREQGRRDGPPTLRFVQPVFDAQGQLFGVVVINADFAELLRSAGFDPTEGNRVHVLTDSGDHMSFGADAAPATLQFHEDAGWAPSPFAAAVASGAGRTDLARVAGSAVRSASIVASRAEAPLTLNLLVETPLTAIHAAARAALLRTAVVSAVLVLLVWVVAQNVAARLPIARLAAALRDAGSAVGFDLTSLPDDETREVALAFSRMSNDLLCQTLRAGAVFESVPDGVVTIDADGRIESANPAMTQLFGYSEAELIGAPVGMLMPDAIAARHPGFVDGATELSGRQVMAANRDIRGRRKDGSLVPLEISVSRFHFGGANHFVGVLRDITERREAEAETAALVAALRRSNEELDKYAFVASHDLKAPLRVIDNVSSWLEEDLEPVLTDDTRDSLAMLRNRVRRMERLLDDLLIHSRIGRTEERAVRISGTELAETLRDLVDLPPAMELEISPQFSGIEIPNMPITTILLNLVNNAIKHHDRPDGRIMLDVNETVGGYEFTVTDDGPGIPPRYHARIFEMFQTLRPRDEVDGSGLGLAIVRKHAEVAGGRIEVASDGGRGTRFTLFWPHDPAPALPTGRAA